MKRSALMIMLMILLLGSAFAQTRPALVADHNSVAAVDRLPGEGLHQAQRLSILFGHQSVGENILGALEALSRQQNDRYGLLRGGKGLVDFQVGRNGQPESKFQHFQQMMEQQGYGNAVDVAMMKLCFVDFGPRCDVDRVFQSYRNTMETLARNYPRVRLVWWTAPLMTNGNQTRHAFNQQVRQYCASQGKILFDLADIESHDARGTETRDASGGPCLCPAWSRDGGHLNPEGSMRVAQAWWWLLARLAGG